MKSVRLAVASAGAIAVACLSYPIIAADGPDEGAAVDALCALTERGFEDA